MRGDQEGCPRNTKWGLFLPGIPVRSLFFARNRPSRHLPLRPFCSLPSPTPLVAHVHIRIAGMTVKPRSGDCRTEAEICPYFGTDRFPVFTMAQWAHLSSAARLPCRRFIPRARRRGSRAVLLGTLFVMRIICPRHSASSNLWKASVMVGMHAKPLRYRVSQSKRLSFLYTLSDTWH